MRPTVAKIIEFRFVQGSKDRGGGDEGSLCCGARLESVFKRRELVGLTSNAFSVLSGSALLASLGSFMRARSGGVGSAIGRSILPSSSFSPGSQVLEPESISSEPAEERASPEEGEFGKGSYIVRTLKKLQVTTIIRGTPLVYLLAC